MRHVPSLLAVVPVAALAPFLFAGCGDVSGVHAIAQAAETTKDAATASAPPEPVVAGTLARKTLVLTTTQPGRIEAFESAPLYGKVSGYVSDVLVDIGDKVKRGQTLVRIAVPELDDDRRQKQALVAQAKAEIGQSHAALRAAEAGVASSQAAIEQTKAAVARAEAEYARWQAESGRLDSLAETGSVTQKVADETRNQFRAADAARHEATAAVHASEAAVTEAQAQVEQARADVVAAEARLTVAESNLARVETMLAYTEIKAPFDGVVTKRSVDTGHFVAEGGTGGPLVSVVRTDRVRVFLDVPEIESAKVEAGDSATIRVQALDNLEVAGNVTRTGWALDNANRTLLTEIDLANGDGRLRPGMYAIASIRLEERKEVLTLPIAAIARRAEEAFCFVIRDGKATRTPIKLGLRVGDDWEVLSGLSESDTVALAKAESLVDGQAIEPVEPAR